MSNEQEQQLHPSGWSVQELMVYLHYEMKWPIAAIAALSKKEMADAVAKDEIDKE